MSAIDNMGTVASLESDHLHQAASSPETLKTEKIRETFLNDLGPFEILSSFLSLEDQVMFSITSSHYRNMHNKLKSDEKSLIEAQLNNGNIGDRDRFDDILKSSLSNAQKTEEIYRRVKRQALAMGRAEPEININGFRKFLISDYLQKKAEGDLLFAEYFLIVLHESHPLKISVKNCKNSVEYKDLTLIEKANKINQIITNFLQNEQNKEFVKGCTRLVLEELEISTVPSWIRCLTNLRTLGLSRNLLTYIPSDLFGCINLQKISVEKNKITELPRGLLGNEGLLTFNAKGNEITKIPEDFLQDTRGDILREVQLGGNKIELLKEDHPFLQIIENLYKNRKEKKQTHDTLEVESEVFDLKEIIPDSLKSKILGEIKVSKTKSIWKRLIRK